MNLTNPSRRQWLKWFGGTAAATVVSAAAAPSPRLLADVMPATPSVSRTRLLRVAQITDIHVQPELRAGEGFAACLRHIQSQPDKPAFILNTGDCVMDASKRDRARTAVQWKLWKDVLRAECSLPVEHTIGNHDVWGWNKAKSGTTGDEPRWGKQYALDELGMDKPYRSFDRGGWHFVVLDSIQPFEDAFAPRLDDEQFAPGTAADKLQEFTDKMLDRIWLERVENLCEQREDLARKIAEVDKDMAEETDAAHKANVLVPLRQQYVARMGNIEEELGQNMKYQGKSTPNLLDEAEVEKLRQSRDPQYYASWKSRVLAHIRRTHGELPWVTSKSL
jgi:3',5'-cyclic AMP phosphodiesterase CpdA